MAEMRALTLRTNIKHNLSDSNPHLLDSYSHTLTREVTPSPSHSIRCLKISIFLPKEECLFPMMLSLQCSCTGQSSIAFLSISRTVPGTLLAFYIFLPSPSPLSIAFPSSIDYLNAPSS